MVVRYPSSIDTPPTIVDDQTPLSGIFLNYLALMLEAIIAELGPMTEIYRNPNIGTLKAFLGVELVNRVSNWKSVAKAQGGNEAGQIFGLLKYRHQTSATGWNTRAFVDPITPSQGLHPSNRLPVVFGQVSNQLSGLSGTDMATAIGGGVRGQTRPSPTAPATSWLGVFRGGPATANGGATTAPGNPQISAHFLLVFMFEAF